MGYLVYDSSTQVAFDDLVLSHLELVIVTKLRRREAFAMSWVESQDNGRGRSTLWLDAAIPLRFYFHGGRAPAIDREWVERLMTAASSARGLLVTDQDGEPAVGTTKDSFSAAW